MDGMVILGILFIVIVVIAVVAFYTAIRNVLGEDSESAVDQEATRETIVIREPGDTQIVYEDRFVTNQREDCFVYPDDPELYVGEVANLNSGYAWYQSHISDGAVVEAVDMNPVPIGSSAASIFLTTPTYTIETYHIDDQYDFPGAGTRRTLSVEFPVNSTITLPVKGIDTASGSSANGDSMEFVFDTPVGIFGLDTLDFESPLGYRGIVKAWDEAGSLIMEEFVETDGNGQVLFIGVVDKFNRMKTIRVTVGDINGGTSTDVFAVAHIHAGVMPALEVCDVNRVIVSNAGGIEVTYTDVMTQTTIVDPVIIASLKQI